MEFKVSVIMSIYNEPEKFICEAVTSILKQSHNNFEFIIIDDNPIRNDVKGILDSFNDNRIIYYKNIENIGLARSMNFAIEHSTTDIFVRMDADDIAEPNRIEIELNTILRDNSDFVFSGFYRINENGDILNKDILSDLTSSNFILKRILIKPSIIHHPTVMFKRDVFEKIGGYRDFPCTQDADLWLRMAENSIKFSYIPQPLLRYRSNPNSVSIRKKFKQQLTVHYINKLSIERLLYGKDSFSRDNYNSFLDKNGFNNVKTEKHFLKSIAQLKTAQNSGILKYIIIRFNVFITCKLLRENYFILTIKKLLLKFYFHKINFHLQ